MLTGGAVAPSELVRVQLLVGDDMLTAWGYVVYQISEMGFAVRFVFQREADKGSIDDLVQRAQLTHV